MLRKTLVAAALVGLVAGIAPIRAEATPTDTAGVIVFVGSARVGSGAWASSTTPAVGNGLCFPGLTANADNTCTVSGATTDITNSWSLKVPDTTVGGTTACLAAGRLGGNTAVDQACQFNFDGYVTANPAGIGPSCGMSQGTSAGGVASDTLVVGGVSYPGAIGWITSAGGSLPITGSVDVGDHNHTVVGYTQARPIEGGNCAQAPARTFLSGGVLAATPA